VIVLEAIFLVVRRARSAEGLKPIEVFGQLAAGVCLLSAVRCALTARIGAGLRGSCRRRSRRTCSIWCAAPAARREAQLLQSR